MRKPGTLGFKKFWLKILLLIFSLNWTILRITVHGGYIPVHGCYIPIHGSYILVHGDYIPVNGGYIPVHGGKTLNKG